MHPVEAGLIEAIRADPHDDATRLVYADWLDEHGDPRGEYVRLEVEFRSSAPERGRLQEICSRRDELETAHLEAWLAPLRPFNPDKVRIEFDGVGPAELVIDGGTPEDLDVLRRAPGINRLRLERCELTLEALRLVAGLQYLGSLTIGGTRIDRSRLELLDALPPWTAVRIYEEGFSGEEWAAFLERRIDRVASWAPDQRRKAALRYLNGLNRDRPTHGTEVRLSQWPVVDAELRWLSWLPELEEVDLSQTRHVTTAGLAHLSGSGRLRDLSIFLTQIDSLVPITACVALQRLNFLAGRSVDVTDDGTAGLERLTNLEALALRYCKIADATLVRIGSLVRLKTLDLDLQELADDACLVALANLRRLQTLTLREGMFQDEVLRHVAGLHDLENVSMNVSGDGSGLRHLSGLTRLRQINLSGTAVNDSSVRHLASLSALRTFVAQHSSLTSAGARWLAARLPEVMIVLDEVVVKSPRPTLTFRRRNLGGVVSALFPVNWKDRSDDPEREIALDEDGWEAPISCSGGVGPAHVALDLFRPVPAGGASAEWDLRLNTLDRNQIPYVLERGVLSLEGAEEEVSCSYSSWNRQRIFCIAATSHLVEFSAGASANQFAEFLPLFRFIASSVRIGAHADHSAEEVVVETRKLV